MSSLSLLGSIFGTAPEKEDSASNASSLFDQAKKLADPPRHDKALPPRIRRPPPAREEVDAKEEEEEPAKKKRKRNKGKSVGQQQQQEEESGDKDVAVGKTAETKGPATDVDSTDNDINHHHQEEEERDDSKNDRTVFVGNLPLNTTRKSLAALFKECGKIESTRLRSVAAAGVKLPPERAGNQNLMKKVCANTSKVDTKTKSTAQGYVVFCSEESVEKALELNNSEVNGVCLRVDHATPTMDASRTVFCGNLPYKADEASLQEYFIKECGMSSRNDVEGVRIVRDKETMQCKGFGYVLFADKSLAATALAKMHKTRNQYMKRTLRVQVCGKRFKNKNTTTNKSKRSFEGKRAETGAAKRISKRKRARGNANSNISGTPGVSKRAAAQAKEGKRIKQIQKRLSKGMGKTRR